MINVQFEYQIAELRAGVRAINRANGLWKRIAILGVCFAGLVLFVIWSEHSTPVPQAPPGSPVTPAAPDSILADTLPWLIILVFGSFFMYRLYRRGNVGKRHSSLGRLWTLQVDEKLVTISDSLQRTERRWGAFRKYVETKNLFLLFTDPKVAVVLPKRIFDAASCDELRRLAETLIKPQISGFPVIPFATRVDPEEAAKSNSSV